MSELPQGSTIGILGGGQLGRMLSVAASRLGYRCHIFEPGAAPAGDVALTVTTASYEDEAALRAFAASVQRCCAFQHRERNRHPDGGFAGLGTSPSSSIRSRDRCATGSGMGAAEMSAAV